MQKPTPEYCYIVCEECGARELANLGNKACIVCHWRLTGEVPTGAKPGLQGLRDACAEAERSAQAFLQEVLSDLLEAGYSAREIEQAYQKTPALTQYYPPSSVYCLTPTTEEAARKAAAPWTPPALAQPREVLTCTRCGADFPAGCCDCEAGDDCPLCGDCCDAALAYCTDCDSPCEGGECDPPHLCRKHGACPKCNS